jgi:hypothetical protein
MISILNEFNYAYEMSINFIAHMVIFIGTFYVALQNRNLRQWHITPLWYVGLAAISTCITILVQWAIGPEHPLSYWNLGRLTETALNIAVASVAAIMLIGTVRADLRNAKKRRNANQGEI